MAMKRIHLLLISLIVLAGCSKDAPDDYIVISPSEDIVVESFSSSVVLNVASSADWTVTQCPAWASVTPSSGKNGDDITVCFEENTSYVERTGSLSIMCGSAVSTLSITQYGQFETNYVELGLEAPNTTLSFDETSGRLSVTYSGGALPKVETGDAVVLPAEHGFDIRVIKRASASGNTLSMETEEGNMSNLFRNVSFILSTDVSAKTKSGKGENVITPVAVGYFDNEDNYYEIYNEESATKGDYYEDCLWTFHKDFDGNRLLSGGAGELYWERCSFDAAFHGYFYFDFGEKQIDEVTKIGDIEFFECALTGSLDLDYLLRYHYENKYSSQADEIVLKNVIPKVSYKFKVGQVPVYINVRTDIGASADINIEGELDASAGVRFGGEAEVGLSWSKEEGVQPFGSYDAYLQPVHPAVVASSSAEIKASYYPHIGIEIYKFLGPWIEPRPYLKESLGAGFRISTDGNNYFGWKAQLYSGMNIKFGLDMNFLAANFNVWESDLYSLLDDQLLIDAPNRIRSISPEEGAVFPADEDVLLVFCVETYNPLLDSYEPCSNALVKVESEDGSMEPLYVLSGEDGLVEVWWIKSEYQEIRETLNIIASILDEDGAVIDEDVQHWIWHK